MNVDFTVMLGTQLGEKQVMVYPTCPDRLNQNAFVPTRVGILVSHHEANTEKSVRVDETHLVLTKSEARALASAIMGCASEL